jgi:hypothetical protein
LVSGPITALSAAMLEVCGVVWSMLLSQRGARPLLLVDVPPWAGQVVPGGLNTRAMLATRSRRPRWIMSAWSGVE